MRGNERIFFIGNMSCLCQTPAESRKQTPFTSWQMKRVVVTESQIYYFFHTSFETQTSIDPRNLSTFEFFQNLSIHMQNLTSQDENITELQERNATSKYNLKGDRDSITSPPLLVQPIIDKQVNLVSFESLISIFNKQGVQVSLPFSDGRGISLFDKNTKVISFKYQNEAPQEINYMITRSNNDAFLFAKACNTALLFQKYVAFSKEKDIQIKQDILLFLQESINIPTPTLKVVIDNDFINQTQIYELLLESSLVISGFEVESSLEISEYLQSLKKVLGGTKNNSQITKIKIAQQGLHAIHLIELYLTISFHIHLEYLNFSNNFIEDKAVELIGKIFETCQDLNHIDLSKNLIQGLDVKFEVFLLKASQLLQKAHLDLSFNFIGEENSVLSIEQRLLFEEHNSLQELNISHNRFSRQNSWRIYCGYIEARSTILPEFNLILFPIPFRVEAFQPSNLQGITRNEEKQVVLPIQKQMHMRQSVFETSDNQFQRQKTMAPFHRPQYSQNEPQIEERSVNIIKSFTNNKQAVKSRAVLEQVREFSRKADEMFKQFNGEPPVEQVYQLTQQVSDFPYQVSLKLVTQLQEHIWNQLNEAILIRDHYSIGYLSFAATNIEIDTSFFHEGFELVSNRKRKLKERIAKFLNFQIQESLMNKELDDLIAQCHRLDVRGYPLNVLIFLKLERDSTIHQLAFDEYDWLLDQYRDPLRDIFAFLTRDADKVNLQVPQPLLELNLDANLWKNALNVNYLQLCRVSLTQFQQNLEALRKLLVKVEALNDREHVTQFAIEEYRESDHVLTEHFGRVALNRLWFICHNQFLSYDSSLWRNNKEEIQMNLVRHSVNYFHQKDRQKEIFQQICSIDNSFQELTLLESLQLIDSADPGTIDPQVQELRHLISYMMIKKRVILVSNPITQPKDIQDQLQVYSQFRYPHLRSTNHTKTPISPTKQQNNNLVSSSMQNIEDSLYDHGVLEIEKQLRIVYGGLDDNNQELLESMQKVIEVIQTSPCPCLFADEMYLRIFLYQNRLTIDKVQFTGQYVYYKVIAVFLMYLPPSSNFNNYIEVQLFSNKDYRKFQVPITKAIQHLRSWSKAQMPDWVPSIIELKERLNLNNSIEIHLETADNSQLSVVVPQFATAGEVMEAIINNKFIENEPDKYAYWIFIQNNFTQCIQEQVIEDIPLLREQIIMEVISDASYEGNKLILKRRVYCAWYSFNINRIQDQQLESVYHEILRKFIKNRYMFKFYNQDSIIRIAAIIYLISQQNTVLAQDYELIPFIPVILSQQFEKDSQISKEIIEQFQNYSNEELKQIFLQMISPNPCAYGTCFQVKAFQFNQGEYQMKLDCLLIVNSFGLLFYEWKDSIQKTYKLFQYEDFIGFSVSKFELRIHLSNIENQFQIILVFSQPRALECYLDILTHMLLRTNEELRPQYAQNEIYKISFHNSMIINVIQNCNLFISNILQEASQMDRNSNFKHQIAQVVNRITQEQQILNIQRSYANHESFLDLLVRKIFQLNCIAKEISFNHIETESLPFYRDCPFLYCEINRAISQMDVSQYFGANAHQEIQRLFEPLREHFSPRPKTQVKSKAQTPLESERQITPGPSSLQRQEQLPFHRVPSQAQIYKQYKVKNPQAHLKKFSLQNFDFLVEGVTKKISADTNQDNSTGQFQKHNRNNSENKNQSGQMNENFVNFPPYKRKSQNKQAKQQQQVFSDTNFYIEENSEQKTLTQSISILSDEQHNINNIQQSVIIINDKDNILNWLKQSSNEQDKLISIKSFNQNTQIDMQSIHLFNNQSFKYSDKDSQEQSKFSQNNNPYIDLTQQQQFQNEKQLREEQKNIDEQLIFNAELTEFISRSNQLDKQITIQQKLISIQNSQIISNENEDQQQRSNYSNEKVNQSSVNNQSSVKLIQIGNHSIISQSQCQKNEIFYPSQDKIEEKQANNGEEFNVFSQTLVNSLNISILQDQKKCNIQFNEQKVIELQQPIEIEQKQNAQVNQQVDQKVVQEQLDQSETNDLSPSKPQLQKALNSALSRFPGRNIKLKQTL